MTRCERKLSPDEKLDLLLKGFYEMTIAFDTLQTTVNAVVAQNGTDKAALAQAQADLAAAQADATAAQGTIDSLNAQLKAILPAPAATTVPST